MSFLAHRSLPATLLWIGIPAAADARLVVGLHHRWGEGGLIAAVALASVAAAAMAPGLVHLLAAIVAAARHAELSPWNGRYDAFEGRQIRIVEADGRLWMHAGDLHDAAGIRRRPEMLATFAPWERTTSSELGEALTLEGLRRLGARSSDARVLRLMRWAERDVHRPWQRKRAEKRPPPR